MALCHPFTLKKKAGKRKRTTKGRDCGCSSHHVTCLLFPRLWRGGPCIMGPALRCSPRHQAWSLGSESTLGWRKCAPCYVICASQLSTPEATGAVNVFSDPAPTKIITHWKTGCFSYPTHCAPYISIAIVAFTVANLPSKVKFYANANTQFRQTPYSYWHLYAFE